jgi:hypothetical protein
VLWGPTFSHSVPQRASNRILARALIACSSSASNTSTRPTVCVLCTKYVFCIRIHEYMYSRLFYIYINIYLFIYLYRSRILFYFFCILKKYFMYPFSFYISMVVFGLLLLWGFWGVLGGFFLFFFFVDPLPFTCR